MESIANKLEGILSGGLWSDWREIEAEEELTVEQIMALARYEKTTKEEQSTTVESGYQPKESIVDLLIGTAPDGALLLLEISPWADK